MKIIVDDLTGPEIAALLEAHTAELRELSPPESKHAFDITQLRRPEITTWTVWDGEALVGCGAMQDLGEGHAELKSMRVVATHTGQGVASTLLQHILNEARARGFSQVSLETGSMAFFTPAHRLYARHGFQRCGPFGKYVDDPNSVFMTKTLQAAGEGIRTMEYRRFGRTNLDVSVAGIGSGGPSQLGQKTGVPESDVHRLIDVALDLGVNLIDTAAAYADSEAILGRALKGKSRDSYIICTKSGDTIRDGDTVRPITEQELVDSVERSHRRLQTDVIDVFQLHAVLPETYDYAVNVLVPVLQRLRDEGKIRFIGITESFAKDPRRDVLRRAVGDGAFDTILVGYNMLTPGPEDDLLPLAESNDIGVMVMCAVRRKIARQADLETVIASLKASGSITQDSVPDERPLDWLVHGDVTQVTDAAYKFVAGNPRVHSVLSGTANVDHLRQNVAAILGDPLPAADRARLKAIFGPVGRKLGD